jgi:hypothetical protein
MRVPSPAASTIVRLERAVIAILSNTAESFVAPTLGERVSPCYPRKRPEFKCAWVFLLMFLD